MKKILFALMMLAGAGSFAGNPETVKITKTTYNITPEPPTTSPNGYLVDCCKPVVLGWDFENCFNILIDCWGACANHGWLVTNCSGVITIRGAFLIPEEHGPKKVQIPLLTGVLADKFNAELDPVSQVAEYKKIENTLISLESQMIIETEEEVFVYAAGTYQIINSQLMVLVTKTQP